jgi:hypothetical protein
MKRNIARLLFIVFIMKSIDSRSISDNDDSRSNESLESDTRSGNTLEHDLEEVVSNIGEERRMNSSNILMPLLKKLIGHDHHEWDNDDEHHHHDDHHHHHHHHDHFKMVGTRDSQFEKHFVLTGKYEANDTSEDHAFEYKLSIIRIMKHLLGN